MSSGYLVRIADATSTTATTNATRNNRCDSANPPARNRTSSTTSSRRSITVQFSVADVQRREPGCCSSRQRETHRTSACPTTCAPHRASRVPTDDASTCGGVYRLCGGCRPPGAHPNGDTTEQRNGGVSTRTPPEAMRVRSITPTRPCSTTHRLVATGRTATTPTRSCLHLVVPPPTRLSLISLGQTSVACQWLFGAVAAVTAVRP